MIQRIVWGASALLVILLVLFFASVRVRVVQPGDTSAAAQPASTLSTTPLPDPPDRIIIPVAGVAINRIADSWGDARGDGKRGHQGTDIMAPGGTPVIAAAPGTIEKLYYSEGGGGITLYERSADRGWIYYYAHLSGYAPGLAEGQRVRAGQPIAMVGDTGNAGAGNTHLHFEVHRLRGDQHWYQGSPVNPWPLLLAGAGRGR